MNRKLTEEEMDAKFEEFMQKLSTDEDSSHSKPLPTQQKTDKTNEPKDTLWWLKGDSTGASSKPGQSWLKTTPKMVSPPERASKKEINQTSENVVSETPVDRKLESDQAQVSKSENPTTIDSELSTMGKSALTANSEESQVPTPSGVYSEDFESGKVSSKDSDASRQIKNDKLKTNKEQLNTLSDVTFNSEDTEDHLQSEPESATVEHSNQPEEDSGKSSPDKQSLSEGEVNIPESKENSPISSPVSVGVPNDLKAQQQSGAKHFNQETFVVKSKGIRGVDEILKEAEEFEKSMSIEITIDKSKKPRLAGGIRQQAKPPLKDTENIEPKRDKTEPKKSEIDIFIHSTNDVSNLQKILKEERRRYAKLQAEVVAQEKENREKLEKQRSFYETKVLRLEADNVHLSAKVDELRQQNISGTKTVHGLDATVQTEAMLKEFKDQEKLIAGYQKENEFLYEQLKNVKNELKVTKKNMGAEIQRLTSELATMKINSHHVDRMELVISNPDKDEIHQHKIDELLYEITRLKVENENSPRNEAMTYQSEVTELKNKIVVLENEIRKRNLEQKSTATVMAAKESRIQSLENQVKHLEQLVNVRNPNSISALVLAAGAAEDSGKQHRTTEFLERRVRELEEKLVARNSEASDSLRAIQEQYAKLKEQYEARIVQLEEQREVKAIKSRPQSSVAALEKELNSIRERHRRETEKMRGEINTLRQELKQKGHRPEANFLSAKVKSLTNELVAKERQNRLLREKLEGANLAIVAPSPLQSPTKPSAGGRQVVPTGQEASDHELKEENSTLKAKVERLIRQVGSLRGALRPVPSQDSNEMRTVVETNRKLRNEVAAKEAELEETKIKLNLASGRISELTYYEETHELVVGRLREKLAAFQSEVEQVQRLRSQNADLRLQCHEIRERLVLAEAAHPPEWKHYAMLQARVQEVERRYEQKNEELRRTLRQFQAIRTASQTNLSILQKEVDKWKSLVFARNRDIERFRTEMDAIITALEVLQTQGPRN